MKTIKILDVKELSTRAKRCILRMGCSNTDELISVWTSKEIVPCGYRPTTKDYVRVKNMGIITKEEIDNYVKGLIA